MNPICGKCFSVIKQVDTIRNVAYCTQCRTEFKILSQLGNLLITQADVRTQVAFPTFKPTIGIKALPVFAVIWLVFGLWYLFYTCDAIRYLPITIALLFAAFSLYVFKSVVRIEIANGSIKVSWHCLGWKYERQTTLSDVRQITTDTTYGENPQPIHRIALILGNGKKITFGLSLTDYEQAWLIAALRKIKLGQ